MKSEIEVQTKDIEKELLKIYENDGQELIHACLFNLIVYSPNTKRTEELKTIIQCVTEKFPCRVFFIEREENQEDLLKVFISSQQVNRDDGKIVYDLIRIKSSEDQLKRIPYILLPHFVPELPIYLLWGQDPTEKSEILSSLINFSSRLIYNSAWADNLQAFSLRLLSFLESIKIEAMDIAWASLSGWKEVLALTFDSPAKIEDLSNIKDVEIGYNKQSKKSIIAAAFLQGWIASRLNWNYLDKEPFNDQAILAYNNKSRDVAVRLRPKAGKEISDGEILSVSITSLNQDSYVLERKEASQKVILHRSTTNSCELPITMQLQDLLKGFNFMREIFYQKLGEHYTSMLRKISEVNWEN